METNKKWQTDIIRCRPSDPIRDSWPTMANQAKFCSSGQEHTSTAPAQPWQAAATFFKVKPVNILVVVDDIHLKLGDLRFRDNGELVDITACEISKLVLANSTPACAWVLEAPSQNQVQHVLGKFTEDETEDRDAMVTKACQAVLVLGWLARRALRWQWAPQSTATAGCHIHRSVMNTPATEETS